MSLIFFLDLFINLFMSQIHLVEFLISPRVFRIFPVLFLSSGLFFAAKKVILDYLELFLFAKLK
jgi:hypothetical protein